MHIAIKRNIFGRERVVPIKAFRKITNKDLWQCETEDGKSFLSDAVYKKVNRRSPARKEQTNATNNLQE